MSTRVSKRGRAGRSVRRTVAAVAVVPLLLAAGCSSGGDSDAVPGSQAPAVSASPSESVSPAMQAPTTPAAEPSPTAEPWELVELPDRGPTVPGVDLERAKNAATVLLAAYVGGLQHGRTENLEKLSDINCDFCRKKIAEVRERAEQGLVLTDDFSWNISEIFAGEPIDGVDGHGVLMKFTTTEWQYANTSGEIVDSEPAEDANLFVLVRKVSDGWVVREVSLVEDESYEKILPLMQG